VKLGGVVMGRGIRPPGGIEGCRTWTMKVREGIVRVTKSSLWGVRMEYGQTSLVWEMRAYSDDQQRDYELNLSTGLKFCLAMCFLGAHEAFTSGMEAKVFHGMKVGGAIVCRSGGVRRATWQRRRQAFRGGVGEKQSGKLKNPWERV